MRKYELTYLVSDSVPESDLNKVTGKVAGIVEELGGKIAKEDIWGRRKLAYPIKKQDFATYVTIYLDLPAEKAIEFEKDLRHIDGIVRQLMIVTEYSNEQLTLTAQEIAETKEIEEVIGGEKSFEAVEGETEESRDLMAKRESQEEEPHFASTSTEATADQEASRGADAEEIEKELSEPEVVEEVEEIAEEEPSQEPEEEKPVRVDKKKVEEKAEKPSVSAKASLDGKKTPAKKKPSFAKATADEKVSDEVERLSKLNEELDDILKDEL